MTYAQVLEIGRDTLTTVLMLALPAMATSLLIGLVISVLQTITSIQDQTLTFVPRIIAVGLAFLFTLSWALQMLTQFFVRMMEHVAEVTR